MASILKVDKIRGTGLDSDTISLDGTGNITIPKNVTFSGTTTGASFAGTGAFSARHAVNEWGSVGNGSIVNFNDDSTGDSFDTDNNYSTSTYKYTAPATGVYLFWFSIYTADGDTSNGFGFLKNTSKVDFANTTDDLMTYVDTVNFDHVQTATIVIPLTSGDTMAVCGALGSSDYYKGHSKWGGCRLA